MSFNYTVLGLQTGVPFSHLETLGPFDGGGTYPCTTFGGDPTTCYDNGSSSDSVTIPIAAWATAAHPSADLFAIRLKIDAPTVWGGTSACRIPGTVYESPCFPDDLTTVDVTTTGGVAAYVDRFGVAVPYPDLHMEGYQTVPGERWPDVQNSAYMVNPSPTWVVPDAQGNTFGTVLFEPADLPVSVTVSISAYCHQQAAQGVITLGATPYEITTVPRRDAPFMCVL